jgi:endonuclease/exonuclease/phosphatase family metal-dependent hydrolase
VPPTSIRRSHPVLVFVSAVLAVVLGLLAFATRVAANETAPDDVSETSPAELHVMSFNLRFASNTPPNSWPERRPVMRKLLRDELPDLIGTQEGLYQQLRDIQTDLPDYYDSIGEGREGGSAGEAMQIFYDTRRLDPLEYGHYWLSDTPETIGSQTWGGCCPRMVTWIRFADLRTGTQFYAINTHLEAFDADARARSADLILERMGRLDADLPVVMTGDFNEPAAEGQTVYDRLVTNGPLLDTWVEAEHRSDLWATFHGYRPLVPDGARIDWILTTPGTATRTALINTFELRGQFPSDHLPVQAVVRLPGS